MAGGRRVIRSLKGWTGTRTAQQQDGSLRGSIPPLVPTSTAVETAKSTKSLAAKLGGKEAQFYWLFLSIFTDLKYKKHTYDTLIYEISIHTYWDAQGDV